MGQQKGNPTPSYQDQAYEALRPNTGARENRNYGTKPVMVDDTISNVEAFAKNIRVWSDTTATITQAYVNYFTGQFTIVKLPPLIANKDELVPTTNASSYSGTAGEINNVIAPIREMIGDTMVLKASHYTSKKVIYTKIVLE